MKTATVKQPGCRSCTSGSADPQGQRFARFGLKARRGWDYLVALAGNPNTGKSTVFNALTGLRQHTGNWPGKTVVRAEGFFSHEDSRVKLVDLPGTYSLHAGSTDEEVARDFILFGRPDVTVVVVDATRLERNLNLVLQILEITHKVVICLNLVDEAARHGLKVDANRLSRLLGVPVVPTAARRGEGIQMLLKAVHQVATGTVKPVPHRIDSYPSEVERALGDLMPRIEGLFPGLHNSRWVALRLLAGDERVGRAILGDELDQLAGGSGSAGDGDSGDNETGGNGDFRSPVPGAAGRMGRGGGDSAPRRQALLDHALELRWSLDPGFQDAITHRIFGAAQDIAGRCVATNNDRGGIVLDGMLDRLLTSRWTGLPIMVLLLMVVFWITIAGSNVPSDFLADLLVGRIHPMLVDLGAWLMLPAAVSGFLFDGVYLATAWVVAVMLPPMAIFFPLFTLLEDFGYLPRVAFNLDSWFRRVGAHGKQALTMCMGFGCNAAGVVAARVIDSPRERLVAIITNNFSLCNGRWPMLFLMATIFLGALAPAHLAGLVSAAAVVGVALLGIVMMFVASWLLTGTVLKGQPSTFSLELPPYRPPRVLQTLYTSVIDRTLIVLRRAVIFAIPAGAATWLMANITVGDVSLAQHAVDLAEPVGWLFGMNGVIVLAFILAIPANEIVIPTVLMLTVLTVGIADAGAGAGVMFEPETAGEVGMLLSMGGWTTLTGVSLMLFSLLHNPCSTTLYTIYKETGSARWTTVAALLPLLMGLVVCFILAQFWRLAF